MIQIDCNIAIDAFSTTDMKLVVSNIMKINYIDIDSVEIIKKSVDARRSKKITWFLSLAVKLKNETGISSNYRPYIKPLRLITELDLPVICNSKQKRIAVVGSGPAGLFAALTLVESGCNPVIFERGSDVENRIKAIQIFNNTGVLDFNTNMQFGEGGAGTFSDGKIGSGISSGYVPVVIGEFLRFGAPAEIKYLRSPHIGKDYLIGIVKKMREYIIKNGGCFNFNTRVTDLKIKNKKVTGITANGIENDFDYVILATGNSGKEITPVYMKKGLIYSRKHSQWVLELSTSSAI
ncbi:MAG: FAD-dependent oxidoreductase [Christensenellaceae bacterium]|jgi:uncharacterized FAD-dependent dehydrogenase|nr:FAD-dependent oxidoreductase [Christensenellaceae bacterium]